MRVQGGGKVLLKSNVFNPWAMLQICTWLNPLPSTYMLHVNICSCAVNSKGSSALQLLLHAATIAVFDAELAATIGVLNDSHDNNESERERERA